MTVARALHARPRPKRDAAARVLLALAAFLALAWQGLVVQTHVHDDGPGRWRDRPAASRLAAPSIGRRADAGGTGGCVLCREQALSGSFTTPDPIIFVIVAASFAAPVAVILRPLAARSSSHAWNSRAPPAPGTATDR